MFTPIIRSLLDTDLYKLTMLSPMLHRFPANQAVYYFVCRDQPEYPLASLQAEVEEQLDHLCTLNYTEEELDYLATKSFFKSDFIDFLRIFHFQRRYITVTTEGDTLKVVARGPQIHVMGFEIFVLSIINELYFRRYATPKSWRRAQAARGEGPHAARLPNSEPGRGSAGAQCTEVREWHEVHRWPVGRCARSGTRSSSSTSARDAGSRANGTRKWSVRSRVKCRSTSRGTSNVYLAKKYGLLAIGTMAHEYLQTFQAVGVQLRNFQKEALEAWVHEYRGDLGVALTDVVGMDAFLADFDLYFAKLFDGLRHDSGDPVVWGEKALAHYQRLRIDAHTSAWCFPMGSISRQALRLYEHFTDRVQCGFGIGTATSNDMGVPALNIVMKLTECNSRPVAESSPDTPPARRCAPTAKGVFRFGHLRRFSDEVA